MTEPCIMDAEIAKISANLTNLKDNFEEFKVNDFHEINNQRVVNGNCIYN